MIHEVRDIQWSAPPNWYQIDLGPGVVDYLEANGEGVCTHSQMESNLDQSNLHDEPLMLVGVG